MTEDLERQGIEKNENPEAVYNNIRNTIIDAQNKIVKTVNSAVVESYWKIGEQIYKECEESERGAYGKHILKYLSDRLTKEFGKGFDYTNLRKMRQFYLSWTHYRLIMRVENPKAREFYAEECAKCGWSTCQLERQIYSFFYERLLASNGDESVRNEIMLPPAA